jgi:YD repeat-containing protein
MTDLTTTDDEGRTVTVETDAHGRTIRETNASGGGVPEIIKAYEYLGLTTRVRENGIIVSETKKDLAGRVVESTDRIGVKEIYNYSFANGKSWVGVNHSNGTYYSRSYYRDGRIEAISGTGVIKFVQGIGHIFSTQS